MLLFLAQLADIRKLVTRSIRPFIVAGGLCFIYDIFAVKTDRRSSTTMPRPLLIEWVMVMRHVGRV